MNKDLTVGKPDKVLWAFCLPLFGSIIFQQLYNIADSLIAGRFIGENALAAVGNSYEITLIFIAFAFGCNIGCSVITSVFYGAKDHKNMKSAISTAMIMSGVICIILMIFGTAFATDLLRLIKTPSIVFNDSKIYLDIYIWGFPFVLFYNIATGIFSAMGDSRTPFYFLAASSVSNILMDIWFVAGFNMGVAGVAWATFICQGISCFLSLIVIFIRLKAIPNEGKIQLFSFRLLLKISKVAIPSILQQSFISIGNIIIQRLINGFGPGIMAGYSAAIKLNNLVITSFTTLGNGISNYAAQNIGARKYKRIPEGFKAGLKMIWILSIPLIIIYSTLGKYLLIFFMDNPSFEAQHSGVIFLRIVAPFYLIISAKLVADGFLRGSDMMGKFMCSTFTDLILRVILAIILSHTALKSTGIWCAWPIGWTIAAGMSVYFYTTGPWDGLSQKKEID